MKFKNYIETESGIKDTSTSPGTAGQVLSSTVTGTSWIDPDTLVSAASKLVVIACKNTYGSTINKGTPVYQTGTVGATDVIEIAPADALISSGSQPAIGLLQTTLNNNGLGNVVITGELLNFTTDPIDGVTPTTGDKIFLKSGGGLTLTKPTGEGNAIQNLGLIGKVSGGNAGSITVSSIMRANDVPNLPTGRIWVGDGNTVVSDTVYLDETNERMGIGTTSPAKKLTIGGIGINNTDGLKIEDPSNTAYGAHYSYDDASSTVEIGGVTNNVLNDCISIARDATRAITINTSENVGIGTISPNSKLQVDGEIDANGGDGYRINGKPWAAESSNNLRLGDWDGEGFSTSIYGSNSSEVMRITGDNVGIGTTSPNYKLDVTGDAYIDETLNIETTISGTLTYGYGGVGAGNLVVGGLNFMSFTPGVITLVNQDTTISAAQDLGVLQFGGKDDQTNGYANGQIICTTAGGAGSGNTGGGIFRFLLSGNTTGSGPTERMRITNAGDVGIGTSGPRSKLQVNGGVQLANDTASPSAPKAGTFRYYTSGNNSYVDMCMQTGASTYAWVNIVTNSW